MKNKINVEELKDGYRKDRINYQICGHFGNGINKEERMVIDPFNPENAIFKVYNQKELVIVFDYLELVIDAYNLL